MKQLIRIISALFLTVCILQPIITQAENTQDSDIYLLWIKAMDSQPMPQTDEALKLALEELIRLKGQAEEMKVKIATTKEQTRVMEERVIALTKLLNNKNESKASPTPVASAVPETPAPETPAPETPATDIEDLGNWMIKYYVDKFGDRTKDKYITTTKAIDGYFSNIATTNSELKVYLLIDSYNKNDYRLSIMLYEYGTHQVKASYTRNYNIYIKASDGTQTTATGYLQTDRITVSSQKLFDALVKGGQVKFVIEEKETVTSYSFTVDTSKLSNALYALTIEK